MLYFNLAIALFLNSSFAKVYFPSKFKVEDAYLFVRLSQEELISLMVF